MIGCWHGENCAADHHLYSITNQSFAARAWRRVSAVLSIVVTKSTTQSSRGGSGGEDESILPRRS